MVPLIVLVGAGFASLVRAAAPWIVLPRIPSVPHLVWLVVALVAMDFCNWSAHWANHRVWVLWRLHAVHHAQEEMSVLTSFRAHPFVHVSFLVAALPAAVLVRNGVVPAEAITIYICLAALPTHNMKQCMMVLLLSSSLLVRSSYLKGEVVRDHDREDSKQL